MKPLYPDGRQSGLPMFRADASVIGTALRIIVIAMLATLAWWTAAAGFEINEAAGFAQRHCTGRGTLLCELGNLLARQVPPSSAGAVDRALRLAFFVLLLLLSAALLKPLLPRRRA
ncbi:hypothetical protein ACG04Q_24730 [Roseateles sp. DXS20W]|uniref:DUF2946 domain-containing protein n=1 Tax=Pelomonas lactea TaxID=3299030 RepID=A0ABW7GSM0_9BURK